MPGRTSTLALSGFIELPQTNTTAPQCSPAGGRERATAFRRGPVRPASGERAMGTIANQLRDLGSAAFSRDRRRRLRSNTARRAGVLPCVERMESRALLSGSPGDLDPTFGNGGTVTTDVAAPT